MTIIRDNLVLIIPVIVAIITSLLAPFVLGKRAEKSDFGAKIIEEGAAIRKELRDRIDNLEKRLDAANDEINMALDEMRRLKSENERFLGTIEELKRELKNNRIEISHRLDELEGR